MYKIENWSDYNFKQINELSDQWKAYVYSSDHFWNLPILDKNIKNIDLYPIVTNWDLNKPDKLLYKWNNINLSKFSLWSNDLVIFHEWLIHNHLLTALDWFWINIWSKNNISIWYIHNEIYKTLNNIWQYKINNFFDRLYLNKDTLYEIINQTFEFIESKYPSQSNQIIKKIFFDKKIKWLKKIEYIKNSKFTNKEIQIQANNIIKNLDNMFGILNWSKSTDTIYSSDMMYFTASFSCFIHELLSEKNQRIIHFSSPSHLAWITNNNIFAELHNFLIKYIEKLSKDLTITIIPQTLRSKLNIINTKREEWDKLIYHNLMNELLVDFMKNNYKINIEKTIKIKEMIVNLSDIKQYIWWMNHIIDNISQSRSDLYTYITLPEEYIINKTNISIDYIDEYRNLSFKKRKEFFDAISIVLQ